MKFISVSTKLNIAVSGISIVSLIIGFFILFSYAQDIKLSVYTQVKQELIDEANEKVASKYRVGITNAISIANDVRIKKALATQQRQPAINSLENISINMKENTEFKNIKIHLHTKDNKSFLRNWKIDKYGDDLSSFRASVVFVNENHKPITTFEPGRAGLLLRAITPIVDENKLHIGSLEFIQGINSVTKSFDKTGEGFLLLMDQKVSEKIKIGKNFSFKKNTKFKDYIISQKYINKTFLTDAKNINMRVLFHDGYFLSSEYFYTYTDVKDFQDKKLGIILLARPLTVVNTAIDGAENLIYIALLGILGMTIVISLIIIIAIKKLVIKPLKKFENGLSDFFSFLQGKKEYVQNINIDTNDEFGQMAKSLKENIAVSAKLHEEINELNSSLEAKVEEKTKKVTTLLDNAGQGFLSFSCDLIIDDEYSKECEKLLGKGLAGKYIPDILFINNPTKQKFFQKTILEACSIDSTLVQESILTLLPNEIILNRRALQLKYKILENKKLMLIITNITAKKKLEKKVKKEQEVLKMIVEIIGESESFYDTKRDYENFIENYVDYIYSTKTSLNNINEIYRVIHTFKGAFSQLYMSDIVKFLHSFETKIATMIKNNEHTNESLLELLQSTDFTSNLNKELEIIRTILGNDFLNSQNILKINCVEISKLQTKIHDVFTEQRIDSLASKEIISHVSNLSNQKLQHLLKPYTGLVQQLSLKLEKEIYEVEVLGDDKILVNEKYKPFIKSLIHIFRNSVDHGIEDQETRLINQKDEIGTISCSFSEDDDRIQIIISDDGIGIDKEKVLSKAIKENILTRAEAETINDADIYALIFHENLSTKSEVSEISGRGIGMNAVKVEADKLAGFIEINSQKNIGTTFVFNLPKYEKEL
ncbi:MAG: two-component system chemotaxis sensor kinase CheA [Sulfurimonas sp.]|jgi:two-component system chemotaxis sensor kinase CheA|uniref:cache domain-containing protein n=1 Tax=Sulfurimonas sp. TaxID=2022749 RepID=UPI0039E3CEE9